MSTPQPGGSRRPSVVATGKKAASGAAKTGAAKTGAGAAKTGAGAAKTGAAKAAAPKAAGRGGPRKPIAPVKVSQGRNWGPIALFVAVGVIAAGIIGYGAYFVYKGSQGWQDQAAGIDGLVDYRKRDPEMVKNGVHQTGTITYTVSPPVGGPHNNAWQRCQGDVYDAPIASEHALHSMEHGAVWVTYKPGLPQDQVARLAERVRNAGDYILMSPFEGLDRPISLQAWGYQLKVDNASDKRIDDFIAALRINASMEPQVTCGTSSGNYVTATGTTPRDNLQQPGQQQPGG